MSKSRAKGTWLENAAVEALRTRWSQAERRVTRGKNDAGDVSGVPYTVEVKNVARFAPAEWWAEAQKESKANGGLPPVVIAKRKGKGQPLDQWVLMDLRTFIEVCA